MKNIWNTGLSYRALCTRQTWMRRGESTTKMVKGLQHISHEEGIRSGIVHFGEEKPQRNPSICIDVTCWEGAKEISLRYSKKLWFLVWLISRRCILGVLWSFCGSNYFKTDWMQPWAIWSCCLWWSREAGSDDFCAFVLLWIISGNLFLCEGLFLNKTTAYSCSDHSGPKKYPQ